MRLWFLALWFVTSQKNGVSALGLQRVLGLGSYETAWTWLHKLHRAMVRPGRDCLSGEIEIDQFVGGREGQARTSRPRTRPLSSWRQQSGAWHWPRPVLHRVADVSADSLIPFIQGHRRAGSTIHTDGSSGFAGLPTLGYQRQEVAVIGGDSNFDHVVMPRVHNVASLLKRWLMGTHQGGMQHRHLDYYLDEFTFRFNGRRSHARGLLFHRLAQQAVAVGPAPVPSDHCHQRPSPRGYVSEGDTHLR